MIYNETYTGFDADSAYTYDDINLVPKYSEILSRSTISLRTKLSVNYNLGIPLIASPMPDVCEFDMALAMMELGGVGCIHRFMTIDEQVNEIFNLKIAADEIKKSPENSNWQVEDVIPVMAAIGANNDYMERAEGLVDAGANVLLIDVAHGDHVLVKNALDKLKSTLPQYVDIIAGNIATSGAASRLVQWGADGIRVGIGGGSLCSTRIKTGFGVPNLSSIDMAFHAADPVPIIACGGIRNSGDIAKALAFGASSVILGSILAGTKETPGNIIESQKGLFKRYRGAASLDVKSTYGQSTHNVEGESSYVPFKGKAHFVVDGLLDGIRSALSYGGANSISEFFPNHVMVTNAGIKEASPHLL